jgi:hemerythrin superfamily protein
VNAFEFLKRQHHDIDTLFQQARAASGREKVAALAKIAETLTLHTALEERFLYPAARQNGLEREAELADLAHSQMKRLLARILGIKQRDPALGGLLTELETTVRTHFSEEEQQLFPRLQQEASGLESSAEMLEEATRELERTELLEAAENEGALLQP